MTNNKTKAPAAKPLPLPLLWAAHRKEKKEKAVVTKKEEEDRASKRKRDEEGKATQPANSMSKTQSRNKRRRIKQEAEAAELAADDAVTKSKIEKDYNAKPNTNLPLRPASKLYVCPGKLGGKWDEKKKTVC